MAEYIYRINPDLTTVQEIFDTDGIVVWDISHTKNRLEKGDKLYIYICKPKNQVVFCETQTVAYVATVLEVLDIIRTSKNVFKKKVKLKITALSYHAVQRIKESNLTANGYSMIQPLTDLSTHPKLKNIIDEAVSFNDEDVIPVLPEKYEDRIINEYETVKRLIDSRIEKGADKKKLHGNISANIFIKYMQAVIDSSELPYKVSPSNSYVDGYGVEWDALIVEKDAVNIMNLNVFEPSKVVAVVEFKTSGLIYKISQFEAEDSPIMKKALNSFASISDKNKRIRFGYLSLEEREPSGKAFKYFSKTCEVIGRKIPKEKFSCFNILNNAGKKRKYNNNCTWSEFVLSLLPD